MLPEGTTIDLAGSGEQFIGFSGEICFGTASCSFTLYRDTTVHAGFTLPEAFQVLYSSPSSGDTGVATNTLPTLFFNRDPFPGPGLSSISFTDEDGTPVPFQPVVRASDRRLVLLHDAPLDRGRRYEVQVPADAVVDEAGASLAAPWGISFTVEEEGVPNMYLAAYPPKILEGNSTKVSIWFETPATTARDISLSSTGGHLEMPSYVTLEAGKSLVELTVRASPSPGSLADVVEDLQATDPGTGQSRTVQVHVLNDTPQTSGTLAWQTSSVFDDEDGDGVFESGETADILFQVANQGSQDISGVYLEFEVLDTPNLQILGGSFQCDIGFLGWGRSGSCSRTVLADDELPSGKYAIRVRGFSSGGNIVDIAPIQVVNRSLPNFQVSTGAVTSSDLDPGQVIMMPVTARNRGDGFSLDLPVFEVVMEMEGAEILLYRIHADARGDIFSSQSFDLPIAAPLVPGSYPIRTRINPPGDGRLTERDYTDNEGTERVLHVAAPNRAPILAPLGSSFTVAAGEVLTVEAAATDEDGDPLTYHLASGAPAGMEVDPTMGVITWSLPCDLTPGSYPAELVVEDPDGASDSAVFTVLTQHLVDRHAELLLDESLATPGQEVGLTFTVTNQGPGCATGLAAQVTPDPSATVVGWTCTATDGSSCSPGQAGPLLDGALDLAVGGVATYRLTVHVDDAATGTVLLEGSAALLDGAQDPNGTNDLGTATLSLRALDFGDAPDGSLVPDLSFPTTLADDGARHGVTPGLALGELVDGELDGQPSYGASGDDASGGADEDGVTFLEPLVPCATASVEVRASAAGLLSAWIDFSRDGSWNEAGDQIATDRLLPPGTSTFDLSVPCSATPGSTYSRFRLSSTAGLAAGGLAVDGEVEDQTVEISPLLRSLDVTVIGTGEITISPGGVPCGTGCTVERPDGTEARLSASALPGSVFVGWSGDGCSGTEDCTLVLDRDRSVVATFALDEPCFGLALDREGSGAVPAAAPDRSAGCDSNRFHAGEQILLTASPAQGWMVTGWLGTDDDSGTEISNELTMPARDHQVVVRYAPTGAPTVLLVDDDDGDPDVRTAYTEALDSLGVLYDVWDTQGTDDEPDAAVLSAYPSVVWFTGGAFRDSAGPGASGETALGTYLDAGGCLVLSSQDYLLDRGQTDFMSQYLGLLSGTSDAKHDSVAGQGDLFDAMGPFTLSYPPDRSPANFSDLLLPDTDAELAFLGDGGEAGIDKAASGYRTVYLGFPLEALASPTAMRQILQTALDFCDRSCTGPYSVDLSGDTVGTSVEVVSCDRIGAGDGYLVLDGGALTLRAPGRIVLRDGFAVEAGGTLRVVIEP